MAPKNFLHARRAATRFIRGMEPQKWEDLKRFLRTGKGGEKFSRSFLQKVTRIGLNFAEARAEVSSRNYKGVFSRKEKVELKRQVNDFVGIIYPSTSHAEMTHLRNTLMKNIELVQRKHIEEMGQRGTHDKLFSSGRMYLEALDPEMGERSAARARKYPHRKAPETRTIGFEDGKMVLEEGWAEDKYAITTPMHEIVHFKFGHDEYRPYLLDFYYNMKRGFMLPGELRERVPKIAEAQDAFENALKLYNKGRVQGWESAEEELRTIFFARKAAARQSR